jgi:hypothetical protein
MRRRGDRDGAGAGRSWFQVGAEGYTPPVPTRAQVRKLIDSGMTHEMAARQLGIAPGLAYMIDTGRPADDDRSPAQDLFEPPHVNPTRNQTVDDWVKACARRDLRPAAR